MTNHLLIESMLEELAVLAIRISSRTDYRASVSIYSKTNHFEVTVYVNREKASRIVTYRKLINYDQLQNEYEECKERLEYFLNN